MHDWSLRVIYPFFPRECLIFHAHDLYLAFWVAIPRPTSFYDYYALTLHVSWLLSLDLVIVYCFETFVVLSSYSLWIPYLRPFRKPLYPFVSALFREPMHSLSRFYVLFRGPVLTLLPPSFGTVSSSGDQYQPYFHPASGGSVLTLFHPLPEAFIYISALFWGIFLPSSGGFQWPYFRSLPGACTKVISSHFWGSY